MDVARKQHRITLFNMWHLSRSLARPLSVCKQGNGMHGFFVLHHYYWQAQTAWMMGSPDTELTRPFVFTRPNSCCSLAWNRRRRGERGVRLHILTSAKHLSWAVHASWARAHLNGYLLPFYPPALKNTMTAMCFISSAVSSCLHQVCAFVLFQALFLFLSDVVMLLKNIACLLYFFL